MESNQALDPIIENEIKIDVGDTTEKAAALACFIKDDMSRRNAVEFGSIVQTKINRIKQKREDIVPPLRHAYERVRDFFDDALRPLDFAKRSLAQAISAYDIDMERKRRLEQERLDAEARRQREEYELKKQAWELEQAHIHALKEHEVWEKSAAADRFRAMRAGKIREEEDARLRHAEEAKAQGNVHKVDRILERPTAIAPAAAQEVQGKALSVQPAPMPPPPPPMAPAPIVARRPDENTISRDEWKWDCISIIDLAKAVAEGRAPADYLAPNRGEIGKDVRRLKAEFLCNGIKTWVERNTVFKANSNVQ